MKKRHIEGTEIAFLLLGYVMGILDYSKSKGWLLILLAMLVVIYFLYKTWRQTK